MITLQGRQSSGDVIVLLLVARRRTGGGRRPVDDVTGTCYCRPMNGRRVGVLSRWRLRRRQRRCGRTGSVVSCLAYDRVVAAAGRPLLCRLRAECGVVVIAVTGRCRLGVDVAARCRRVSVHVRMRRQNTSTAVKHPCLLYTSPSPRDRTRSRMPSSA